MTEYHKLIVEIYGGKYPIKTVEEPDYVSELARELDKATRELMKNGSSASLNEALVLLALSYLDAYKKSEQSADHLRGQIAEYLEDAAKSRAEVGEARKEIARLEGQLSGKEGRRA